MIMNTRSDLMPRSMWRHRPDRGRRAFTLTELLVVVGTLGILAAVLLPALAGTQPAGVKAFQCLENTRRLTVAWQLYAGDNSDRLVYSSDDGTGSPYVTSMSGVHLNNNYAWTWSKMDFSGNNVYNWDPNADIKLRPLWQYVKDLAVYKCPSDESQVTIGYLPSGYNGPYAIGSIVSRIRSYSMNFYIGGFGANPALGPGGSWGKYYPPYLKLTEFGNLGKSPGPDQTFVFIDERSDCINWGNFSTDMSGAASPVNKTIPALYQWNEDLPSSYHDQAASISFADGHAEIHRWKVPNTYPSLVNNGSLLLNGASKVVLAPYSQDVAWMQNVSARPH